MFSSPLSDILNEKNLERTGKRTSERSDAGVDGQKEKTLKRALTVGLFVIIGFAVAGFALAMFFFDNPRISPHSLYNAGVDVLGSLICAVLFFGCMAQLENATLHFICLIVLTSLSFYNNEWYWYLSGMAQFRTIYLILSVLTELMDLGLTYFFYRYVRQIMSFEGKVARWTDRAARFLLVPAVLLVLVNFFVPVCFRVDAEGVFHQEPLFRLTDLYMVLITLPTAYLVLRSAAPQRSKIVALSFIVIPVFHYAITEGAFGYSTQYGSVLVALIMMYCVLFNERSRKLAVIQTDLQTGTRIQASMLPHEFPPFPDRKEFDIYAEMDPAREVGGDFYDFFLIDEDHLGLVIADVSGKGIPGALFMMVSKVILESCAMLGKSAGETLIKTNEAICSNNQVEMFVTVWFGILEISTGKMTCANAGHEYPALKRADGSFELLKDRHGLVIGAMDGVAYKEYEIQLHPGDKLFVYTDGVPEATNAENKLFGTDRMIAALNEDGGADPQRLLLNVRRAVDRFVKEAEQFDDLTMLCIRYNGPAPSATEG